MARKKQTTTQKTLQNINSRTTAVSQKIVFRASPRVTQEIQNWKNALQSAESIVPRRTQLYDLYDDILLDARLWAVMDKRIKSITNADWEFISDGKIVDVINDLTDTPQFEYLLREIMLTTFWGYSMIECDFSGQNFNFYSIPRKHIRPLTGMVAHEQYADGDINIREGMFVNTVLEVGEARDLGLLLKAAPYVIYKRGGFGDWAQFVEIFGRPFLKGKYNGYDLEQKREIEQVLSEAGKINAVVYPEGAEISVEQATNASSNSDSFDTFRKACNEEITTLILGQTMTTTDGASKSQSETHKDVEEEINKSDRLFVRRVLNTRFLEMLNTAGFPTAGGYFNIKGDGEADVNPSDRLKMLVTVKQDLELPIDADQVYDEFGINKPADFDAQMKEKAQMATQNAEIERKIPEVSTDKNARTPIVSGRKKTSNPDVSDGENGVNLSLWKRVLRLFQPAPAVTTGATITPICCSETHTIRLADFAQNKVLEAQNKRLIQKVWDGKGELLFDVDTFQTTAQLLLNGFESGFKRGGKVELSDVGFHYGEGFDDAQLTAYEMNLFRFAGVKNLYTLNQLNQAFRTSKSFTDFKAKAEGIVKIQNSAWLETEYNSAVTVGNQAASYASLMLSRNQLKFWRYKSQEDGRVRPLHVVLDNVVLPWNDPLWDKIFPPNDWNCRCYVVAEVYASPEEIAESRSRVQTYFNSPEFSKSKSGGFGVTRFKKGEVFAENQSYVRDDKGANVLLDKIDYLYYGLKDYKLKISETVSKMSGKFSESQKDEAVGDFLDELEKVSKNKRRMTDYRGRKIDIDIRTVKTHTNPNKDGGKYKERHVYLDDLKKVISEPDEVWLNNHKGGMLNNYIYIKHFDSVSIAFVAELGEDLSLQLNTWYDLKSNDIRKGLLIFNR